MKKLIPKRYNSACTILFALCCLLPLLSGCSAKKAGSEYVPKASRDGYIRVVLPSNIFSSETPQAMYDNEKSRKEEYIKSYGEDGWQTYLDEEAGYSALELTSEGEICYLYTPEQYELHRAGYLRIATEGYGLNEMMDITKCELVNADENGIPWGIATTFSEWDDKKLEPRVSVAGQFQAQFLGFYQILCGVPKEQWRVQVTFLDEDGNTLLEREYPRDSAPKETAAEP